MDSATRLRGRDLVVFSNDWDGDPLSKMHIMRILARDNRILWVNSIGNRAPRANAHDLRRVGRKLAGLFRGLKQVDRNIHVLSPAALPWFGSAAARKLSAALLRTQIRWAMAWLGFQRPISWSYLPSSAAVSGTLGEELVVYQCVDEFAAFEDTDGKVIAELERQLIARSDLVITSAEPLRQAKARLHPNTVLIRHGVDYEHFVQACAASTRVPDELARLPRPILGFFGLIAHWVDLEAIAACARAHPQGSVVLLGKVGPEVDLKPLVGLGNVHVLGRKPYAELPGYCRGFDVALLPFRDTELARNANPLKAREYLAAGLPVVSSPIPEVTALGLCKLAGTPEEFPARVAECLAEGAGPSIERAQRMKAEAWEARVAEIGRCVTAALEERGRPAGDLVMQPAR